MNDKKIVTLTPIEIDRLYRIASQHPESAFVIKQEEFSSGTGFTTNIYEVGKDKAYDITDISVW